MPKIINDLIEFEKQFTKFAQQPTPPAQPTQPAQQGSPGTTAYSLYYMVGGRKKPIAIFSSIEKAQQYMQQINTQRTQKGQQRLSSGTETVNIDPTSFSIMGAVDALTE